jgi:peptidoglycan/LPS O-acetylase OafA/YrhL
VASRTSWRRARGALHRRDDIQGLRAVAVLLVAFDHAGVPYLSGGYVGVDVFFVLSGFLITRILLAEAERSGSVSLRNFYARRARRILPAAALTLVATDVAAHHLLNFVRARQVISDSLWAGAFGANVHFARQSGDYFAQGQPPSPLLHFWSLAVEEQFYLVWPTVLAFVLFGTLFGSRIRIRRRLPLLIVTIGVGTASLAWSIASTSSAEGPTYFSTVARAWELALGAAVAIALPCLRPPRARVQVALGWVGFTAVVTAAVSFSSATPFPGYAATLPAAGAALVIAAGDRQLRNGLALGRLLSCAPLRYLGDRSYAFYLWHWPVLVLSVQYVGHVLPVGPKLLLLVGALALSVVSYRFFEDPIRKAKPPKRLGAVLWTASAAAVLVTALLILRSVGASATRVEAAAAAVEAAPLVDPAAAAEARQPPVKPLPAVVAAVRAAERGAPLPSPLTPGVDSLRTDFYFFPDGCTPGRYETSSKICRLGNPGARKTIVVFGDSHAEMWMPTILAMGRRDGWTVIPLVKVRCIPRSWPGSDDCGGWYRWAKRQAQALRPDVTLIIGSRAGTYDPLDAIKPVAALSTAMKRASASVIVVGDEPNQTRDPIDCLLAPRATMKTCTVQGTAVQLRTEAAVESNASRSGVGFIDTRPWFCAHPSGSPTGYLCPLVVNRTITSIDRGHISKTYALELAQPFRAAFRRELFR